MSTTKSLGRAASATILVSLTLGQFGCATRGFVRDRVSELDSTMSSRHASLERGVSDAQQKAENAAFGSERARSLALGNIEFKPIEDHAVFFAFDDAALNDEAVAELQRAVATLQTRPELLAEIYGYADTTGPADYNEELSRRRALAVHRFLVEHAEGPLWRFALVGFGESFPVVSQNEEDLAASRRVVVRIVERAEPGAAPEGSRSGV
jgi:outer membrane protein OmpA-like peptidoglycan-associated protein